IGVEEKQLRTSIELILCIVFRSRVEFEAGLVEWKVLATTMGGHVYLEIFTLAQRHAVETHVVGDEFGTRLWPRFTVYVEHRAARDGRALVVLLLVPLDQALPLGLRVEP